MRPLIAIAVIIEIIAWPFAVIWALNTLFSLSIEYSFVNWLAATILTVTIRSITLKQS